MGAISPEDRAECEEIIRLVREARDRLKSIPARVQHEVVRDFLEHALDDLTNAGCSVNAMVRSDAAMDALWAERPSILSDSMLIPEGPGCRICGEQMMIHSSGHSSGYICRNVLNAQHRAATKAEHGM